MTTTPDTTIRAALRLVADAQAAGLRVTWRRNDDIFLVVAVVNPQTDAVVIAEWWDTPSIREHNYSTVGRSGGRQVRAQSLKAARQHVGLA